MKTQSTIRSIFAAFFLLLFSLCVTPKRYLHDLLANHKDQQGLSCQTQEQISATGYHCHIDELVVVEPFLPGFIPPIGQILPSSSHQYQESFVFFTLKFLPTADGRGPPIAFCS